MEKEQLKRIFDFLEKNEGHILPLKWKILNNEPLTKEDLDVKGDLPLTDSNITSLPEGLKVGGFLNIRNTKITSLPEGLEVEGFLFIYQTPLTKYTDEELREMIKPGYIKGIIFR